MKRDDDGFTLIELIVTVAILGMIFSVVAAVYTVSFKTTEEAKGRTSTAADEDFLTTYFADDVASATSATVPGGDIVSFTITDFDSSTYAQITKTVRYRLVGSQVHRIVSSPASDIVVARDIRTATYSSWTLSLTPNTVGVPAYSITGTRRTA